MYKGIGAYRGVEVPQEDGLWYAAAHLDCLTTAEQRALRQMMQEGLTAAELEEWYFSGGFCQVEEE